MNTRKIKNFFKYNVLTGKLYEELLTIRDARVYHNKFDYKGVFKRRSGDKEQLCIILAGYKSFLYPAFFGRVERFINENIDVCVISSGRFDRELDRRCEKNGWSYLSTKENNVSLVQNVAIKLHPKAQYIFKLDEDIFITENYFENMLRAYQHAIKGEYEPGIIAPLIPINGYGNVRILEMLDLKEVYKEKFEKVMYMTGSHRMVENSPDVARFFWGEGGFVPKIDAMNEIASKRDIDERPCPIKFSIGAILFSRKLWEDMKYFDVDRNGTAMGIDEKQICSFCFLNSRPILISENVVVGHLSFFYQNAKMREFYELHPEQFM